MLAPKLEVDLCYITCGTCGVPHAIPQALYDKCVKEGGFWHCPNGHSRGFGEGTQTAELKRVRQQLAEAERRRIEALARANEETVRADKAEAATKAVKRRVHNGVCPCCKRTFANLARHMKSKHPDAH